MAFRRCGLLAWVLLGVSGCGAGSAFEVGATHQAVEGGEIDETHSAVFGVLSRQADGNALCSATLIAPNLMLTARHCVAPKSGEERVDCATDRFLEAIEPTKLKFSNATTPQWDDRWYTARRILVDETSDSACGHDIALAILEESVPSERAVPVTPRLERSVVVDEAYTAVGYGLDDVDPMTAVSGTRHERSGLSVACLGMTCSDDVTGSEFVGMQGVCNGDSGGPALDAGGQVIGLLSRGADGCAEPVYTYVAQFRALLLQAAALAAADSGAALAHWAGGPEPSAPVSSQKPPLETPPADAGVVEQPDAPGAQWREASCDFAAGSGAPSWHGFGLVVLAGWLQSRSRRHRGSRR